MGLSQAKKKIKLSHDPNNTNWTKDTSSFGHKILASQGWTPGQYLGAKDAPHAEYHSAANASHIRVVLKDDTLGLGAKKGSGQGPGECTGLDAFARLLGRLNAPDQDEYVQEEKRREDLKKAIYSEQRWGSMRFVKGGFLVGDKVVEIAEAEAERVRNLGKEIDSGSSEDSQEEVEEKTATKKKEKKSKKSKGQSDEDESKKSKKSKGRSNEDDSEKKLRKKEKKDKKKKKASPEETEQDPVEETKAERKLRKKEKKEKKRKAAEEAFTSTSSKSENDSTSSKKSKKRRHTESTPDDTPDASESTRKHKKKKSKKSPTPSEDSESEEETPERNVSRPALVRGIHAVRARAIARKRVSNMDQAALNEIFMIKG